MKLLSQFLKPLSQKDHTGKSFSSDIDVILFLKKNSSKMGIVLKNSALLLDYNTFMSFRIQSGNLCFAKEIKACQCNERLNKDYLEAYFNQNNDNPYALYHVMRCIHRGEPVNDLTQFPPLSVNYKSDEERNEAIERLIKSAKAGDAIFSRPITSNPISSIIRKIDQVPFSHVGLYIGEGKTVDAGLDGITINEIYNMGVSSHLALYSLKSEISDAQRKDIVSFVIEKSKKPTSYNYIGVFKIFLRKRFKLPLKCAASIADIIYSGKLKLITYV